MRQKLRGLVGQRMNGAKDLITPYVTNFPPGSHSWTPPEAGWYKFCAWGHGGIGNATGSGGSGGYCEITRSLAPGQTVTIVVGQCPFGSGATNTTITFPDGKVVTAGSTDGATAGTASGGDVNLAGTAGSTSITGASGGSGSGSGGGAGGAGAAGTHNGGAGAPGVLPFRGGRGGKGNASSSESAQGATPGGGGGMPASGGEPGGDGLVIVQRVRITP